MTANEAESFLRHTLERYNDGHPISDREHQDMRVHMIMMILFTAEQTREMQKMVLQLQKTLDERLPPKTAEALTEIVSQHEAVKIVSVTLKNIALFITAVAAAIVVTRTALMDFFKIGDHK